MTDVTAAPAGTAVSLPAGSYDHDALQTGLGKALKGKPENLDAATAKAIDAARVGDAVSADPALVPGHAYVDVETRFGTERQQVYVPPAKPELADQPVDDDAAMLALEERNVKAVKAQVADAVKEGEVAPELEPEVAVQSQPAAAAPGADAPAESQK